MVQEDNFNNLEELHNIIGHRKIYDTINHVFLRLFLKGEKERVSNMAPLFSVFF